MSLICLAIVQDRFEHHQRGRLLPEWAGVAAVAQGRVCGGGECGGGEETAAD